MYASVRIAGQPMTSAVIHGHDRYSFPNPNEPFTWIKAVPAVPNEGEPVESVEVEIKTGDVRFAGTDDDVFLRLGPGLRFNARQAALRRLRARRPRHLQRPDRRRGAARHARRRHPRGHDREVARRHRRRLAARRREAVRQRPPALQQAQRQPLARGRRPHVHGARLRAQRAARDRRSRSGCGSTRTTSSTAATTRATSTRSTSAARSPSATRRGRRSSAGPRAAGATAAGSTTATRRRSPTGSRRSRRRRSASSRRRPRRRPRRPRPDLVITSFFYNSVTVTNQGPGAAGPFRLRAGDATTSAFESFAGLAPGESATRAAAAHLRAVLRRAGRRPVTGRGDRRGEQHQGAPSPPSAEPQPESNQAGGDCREAGQDETDQSGRSLGAPSVAVDALVATGVWGWCRRRGWWLAVRAQGELCPVKIAPLDDASYAPPRMTATLGQLRMATLENRRPRPR